jgi:hypothetical protein
VRYSAISRESVCQIHDQRQEKLANNFGKIEIIHEDPERCADILMDRLKREGVDNVKIVENDEIEEMIPNTLEIRIDNVPGYIRTLACHNYTTSRWTTKRKGCDHRYDDHVLSGDVLHQQG